MNIEHLYNCYLECDNVSTDTRKIEENSIFFALKGENFNGNTFASEALKIGAKYCVVDEKEFALNNNCILVNDVLTSLQKLATHHRKQLNIPIISLTGSNGKTTTKELINAVLSKKFKTTATKGNLNNHIGVPLTLLSMDTDTEIGIVEMGANHHKEIEFLSNIALPDYGLITNFGKAHLEGFGSLQGVVEAKSELYKHLKLHNKVIFVNENDAQQIKQVGDYKNKIMFGNAIELIDSEQYLVLNFKNKTIQTQLTGIYNLNNISVAIAIGSYFKVEVKDIINAIENYTPNNNRSQIINNKTNTILLDAYNANPTSMMAALDNFINHYKGEKVLFLGDMFELGSTASEEHQKIVSYLENNFEGNVFLIGNNFYQTKSLDSKIKCFKNFEDLKNELLKQPIENKKILIKGSRGMALERILEII